jgi:orotate phosphoribosyltransferase
MIARILVLHCGAIGDFLLSLPAIRALRDLFPGAVLEILGRPSIAALALDGRHAEAIHDQERPHLSRLFVEGGRIPPELARFFASFDLVVPFLRDPDGVLARNLERAGAGRVVATSVLPDPGSGLHAADHAIRGLAPLGLAPAPARPARIRPPAGWLDAAEALLGRDDLESAPVVVHPGSGSPAKNWPPEAFARVLGRLEVPEEVPVVVTRGEADSDQADRLIGSARHRRSMRLDAPELPVLAAILSRARLYLGNDSGITHLAAAVGAPTVAIFGPTDPRIWGPRGAHVRTIRGRSLPEGAGIDADDPTPGVVAAIARGLLEGAPPPSSAGAGVLHCRPIRRKESQMSERVTRARLLDVLVEESLRFGTFRLVSGKTSHYYIDGKRTTLHPEGLHLVATEFLRELERFDPSAVGGVTLGGDPIVGGIAALSHGTPKPLPAFIIRKEAKGHGTGNRIEGRTLVPGERVAIVEDVVSTGGSALRAVDAVQETGARVVAVLAIVDREMGATEAFAERDIPYVPLFTKSDLLARAEALGRVPSPSGDA